MWSDPQQRRADAERRLRNALVRVVRPQDRSAWTVEERLTSIERDVAWAKRGAYVLGTILLPLLLEVFATVAPIVVEFVKRYAAG